MSVWFVVSLVLWFAAVATAVLGLKVQARSHNINAGVGFMFAAVSTFVGGWATYVIGVATL